MKTILLLACFLVFTMTSYSQQNHISRPLTYEGYMKKSKNQKTAGEVLLVGGLLMVTIGAFTSITEDPLAGDEFETILSSVGAASVACSMPFFILSGDNKRKAASISLEHQPVSHYLPNQLILNTQPALTIKIGL